jgi:hypothetical protein
VSQLRLVLPVASFSFPAKGDVSHDESVVFSTQQVEAAGAEFDGECSSVGSSGIEFPTTRLGGGRMNVKLQSREKIGRILDQFGKIVTDQSMARARKQRFDRRVDRLDRATRIDRKDTVRHGVQDRCTQAFTASTCNTTPYVFARIQSWPPKKHMVHAKSGRADREPLVEGP